MNWYCKTTTNMVNKENMYELSFPKRNGVGFGSILYRFFFAYLDSRYVCFGYGAVNLFFLYQEAGNALERVQRVHEPADLWDITF